MPDTWDADVYRQRALAWRHRAADFPDGDDQKAACISIAEGYEKLADMLDLRTKLIAPAPEA
jgi:hypothetical protein